jgi:hypothetical protein
MNPYRNTTKATQNIENPAACEDDSTVAWVWFGLGCLLVFTDIGQPGPWGTWSTLGMLLSALAAAALSQHYALKWRIRVARRRAAKHQTPEV